MIPPEPLRYRYRDEAAVTFGPRTLITDAGAGVLPWEVELGLGFWVKVRVRVRVSYTPNNMYLEG